MLLDTKDIRLQTLSGQKCSGWETNTGCENETHVFCAGDTLVVFHSGVTSFVGAADGLTDFWALAARPHGSSEQGYFSSIFRLIRLFYTIALFTTMEGGSVNCNSVALIRKELWNDKPKPTKLFVSLIKFLFLPL